MKFKHGNDKIYVDVDCQVFINGEKLADLMDSYQEDGSVEWYCTGHYETPNTFATPKEAIVEYITYMKIVIKSVRGGLHS